MSRSSKFRREEETVFKCDLGSICRYPVSYVISCRNDNRLVFQTFDKAIAANPGARPLFTATESSVYKQAISKETEKNRKWNSRCQKSWALH